MACLDPCMMFMEPAACLKKMKSLVDRLIHSKQLPGGISAGDAVIQQFGAYLDESARHENVKEFNITDPDARIDTFLYEKICKGNPQLWDVCENILVISHGQATVEQGLSVNKEVEVCNMHEDTQALMVITNDVLTITNASPEQSQSAFKSTGPTPSSSPVSTAPPVVPSTSLSPLPGMSATPNKEMIQRFSAQSGMNAGWSQKCLEENGWNYEKAGLVFTELHSQGKIPQDAFVK